MKKELIQRAYEEVAFLSERLKGTEIDWNLPEGEFEKIPPLEKEEIAMDVLRLIPPRYLADLYGGSLIRTNTSGSTGKCLEIYWSMEDCRRSLYPLWFYRKKFYSICTWDKRCQFYTISRPGPEEEKVRYRDYGLEFSKTDLDEERLVWIYKEMKKYEPVWMILQPCIAELLCLVKEKYGLPELDSVRYIEMTGEMLSKELKERIEKTFHCIVANQYGMNEVNSIAYECPEGNLHCMDENVAVEILDEEGNVLPDGKEGNIYVTTCHNQVMPFIRYGTGDRGVLETTQCSCGCRGKVLRLLTGRKNEWVLTRDREKVTPYVFMRAAEAVNYLTDFSILQYEIIQRDYDDFLVRIVLDEPVEGIPEMFVENIGHASLQDARYEFWFENELFPDETGKRSFFKNQIGIEDT